MELEIKIKECEEALAKDKDERIQRLLDIQRNLEKEIESLKAALDIKNLDLFELRTKNNELVTQVDNYNELNMKLRRYKQEVEQLNAILKNKQEAERRASEHNRLLAMKIEVKNRENQRLSMQNEQLQFRLQSQPNLSLSNNDNSYTSENVSPIGVDQYTEPVPQTFENTKAKLTRASTLGCHSFGIQNEVNSASLEPQLSHESQVACVKLRSKSFKAHATSKSSELNKKLFSSYHQNMSHNQFRPVSENFDFDLTDRDVYMTRSVIMYDSNQASNYLANNNDYECLVNDIATGFEAMIESANDACNSTSSSNSHLGSNQSDIAQSTPCITESDKNQNSVIILD